MKTLLTLSVSLIILGATILKLEARNVHKTTEAVATEAKVLPITTSEFKQKVWDYSLNKDEIIPLSDKPIIIDLFATWCPPCHKLSPILDQIQKEYGDKIQIYKVDVDKEKELKELFEAQSIPMMIFIPTKGNGEATSLVGLYPKEEIENVITNQLKVTK